MFASGAVGTKPPPSAPIDIPGLGNVVLGDANWYVEPGERVRECRDAIAQLNGGLGTIRTCIQRFQAFEADPTEACRTAVREAYEAVPEHLRLYCGDMDSKDWPIRRALYGEEPDYPLD